MLQKQCLYSQAMQGNLQHAYIILYYIAMPIAILMASLLSEIHN